MKYNTIICLHVFLLGLRIAHAQPGNPDPSFGKNGEARINLAYSQDHATSVVVLPDGKVLIGGHTNYGDDYRFALLRLLPDGSPDPDFGTKGFRMEPLLLANTASAIALLPDGRIRLGGNYGLRFKSVQYKPDGTLDSTYRFQSSHSITPYSYSQAYAMAALPDGASFLGGRTDPNNSDLKYARYALLKLRPTGVPDSTFGQDGHITQIVGGYPSEIKALSIRPDGRILATGHFNGNQQHDIAVVQYLPNGTIDSTFGLNGQVNLAFNPLSDDLAGAAVLLSDGRLITGGSSRISSNRDFLLCSLLPNGGPDPAFGQNGQARVYAGFGNDHCTALALLPDGKILAAGIAQGATDDDFAVVCLLPDGQPDPAFGQNGRVIVPVGMGNDTCRAIAVQPDGRIILVGSAISAFRSDIAVVRLLPDGSLDSNFGTDGKILVNYGHYFNRLHNTLILPDDKILVSSQGYNYDLERSYSEITRLLPDGQVDSTFGQNGFITLSSDYQYSSFTAMARQTDGKILAGGSITVKNGFNSDIAIYRLLPDGEIDTAFGVQGKAQTDFFQRHDNINALLQLPDGKILAAGSVEDMVDYKDRMAIVRYLPDGTLDPSFGDNGVRIIHFGNSGSYARQIYLQEDGKILLCGAISDFFGSYNAVLARLMPDGSPDLAFGDNGTVKLPYDSGIKYQAFFDVCTQTDGKIAAVGFEEESNSPYSASKMLMALFLPNGTPDASFGNGGRQILSYGGSANNLLRDNQGNLLVAGSTWDGDDRDSIVLFRFRPDGSPDRCFGQNGKIVWSPTQFVAYYFFNSALGLQSNGEIILATTWNERQEHDLFLARFHGGPSPELQIAIHDEPGVFIDYATVLINDQCQPRQLPLACVPDSLCLCHEDVTEITPRHNTYWINGISTFDVYRINKFILGLEPFDSPYKMIAADVNRSNSITPQDFILLRRLILGLIDTFPNNTSWRFVDQDFVFPDPANPFGTGFPESIALQPDSPDSLARFVAIKIGDVNNDHILDCSTPDPGNDRAVANCTLVPMQTADPGIWQVALVSRTAGNWAAVQGSLRFNPRQLSWLGADLKGLPDAGNEWAAMPDKSDDEVRFSWFAPDGTSSEIKPGDTLFSLRFFRLENTQDRSPELSPAADFRNAIFLPDGTAQPLSFASEMPANPSDALQARVLPNPTNGATALQCFLPEEGAFTFQLMDQTGRAVLKKVVWLPHGKQTIPLQESADLPAGVYGWLLSDAKGNRTQGKLLRL